MKNIYGIHLQSLHYRNNWCDLRLLKLHPEKSTHLHDRKTSDNIDNYTAWQSVEEEWKWKRKNIQLYWFTWIPHAHFRKYKKLFLGHNWNKSFCKKMVLTLYKSSLRSLILNVQVWSGPYKVKYIEKNETVQGRATKLWLFMKLYCTLWYIGWLVYFKL